MVRDFRYAHFNSLALASFVLAMFSSLSLVHQGLYVFGIAGIITGVIAIGETWRYEHFGRSLARWGVVLSLVLGFSGPALQYLEHRALLLNFRRESPPGYLRLDFGSVARQRNLSLGEEHKTLEEYIGRRVCIKGYAHTMDNSGNTFGLTASGAPGEHESTVQFTPEYPIPSEWLNQGLAVSGILWLVPEGRRKPNTPRYELLHPVIRSSRSSMQLAGRRQSGGC